MVAACMVVNLVQAFRRRRQSIDPFLLFACTLGALLIPAISYDYTLPILAAPFAHLLSSMCSGPVETLPARHRMSTAAAAFLLSIGYATMLFSYVNKPAFMKNNSPVLLAMLLCVTWLSKSKAADAIAPT
jgi:hypothetical protein